MSLRMEAGFERFKDALASTLARVVEFPPGMLVTVLGAKITANTRHAKVILSVFPASAEKQALEILEQAEGDIKHDMSQRLRLRRIPLIHYVFDETEAHAAAIEDIINHLEN